VLDEASAQERELQQLRRRIRELEAENDFLKKVSAYFAKNPQ
jgi:transposase-like protein